jgi:NTE family protein
MDLMRQTLERLRAMLAVPKPACSFGLVLSGGGARAAYQAGVLSYIAEAFGDVRSPIITGVSAGSLNAAHIANHTGGFRLGVHELTDVWENLTSEDVYEAESSLKLFWHMLGNRISGDTDEMIPRAGVLDTTRLRMFLTEKLGAPNGRLTGIDVNIAAGRLKGCAFIATNYGTGQSVAWVDGVQMKGWDRATRVSHDGPLSVDHILASSSLPFLFPAMEVDGAFYGDGGIRLADPLSPAIHMGANRILAISTRYKRTRQEADQPVVTGYPPAAQIFGLLLNAIFLDRLDQDAHNLSRVNELVRKLPPSQRGGLRPIDFMIIRPSRDLGKLSGEYQSELKGILKLISSGLGSRDTKSPDWLSMILFEPDYARQLMEIGYEDAVAKRDALAQFLDPAIPGAC